MRKESRKTTTNIYLAAAYLTSGARLENTDYSDRNHIKFTFTGDEDLDIIERDFDNDELVGSLSSYAENLRKVKSKLYV